VKNIVRELNNEKVDIIRWSDDKHDFVTDALKPAIIRSITLDEENQVINVTVDEEDLSKAIGRRGQNARLTSKLVDWDVQVRKDESQHEQFEARVLDASSHLADELQIDPLIADKLFRAGGASADLVVQMPAEYIITAAELTPEQAEEILEKARKVTGEVAAAAEPAAASEVLTDEAAPAAEVEEVAKVEAAPEEVEAPEAATTTEEI
jgi:N utilization substance protein A